MPEHLFVVSNRSCILHAKGMFIFQPTVFHCSPKYFQKYNETVQNKMKYGGCFTKIQYA